MGSFDEDVSVYNGHYEIEIVVNRPIAQVWKQYVDLPSWVTSHRIENVYGEPGTVGSITRVSSHKARELGLPPPQYHYCKLIKIIPQQQWLLKTYAEKGGSYGLESMTAFDDARVYALDEGRSRVTFNLFAEIKGEAVAKDPAAMNLDDSRNGMLANLNNLKRLLETN